MDIMDHDAKRGKKVFATIKSIAPMLVPFLSAFCAYFVLWLPTADPSPFSALVKCLPVLCLGFFVLVQAFSLGALRPYSRKVLLGLVFSALGDVFLTWGDRGYFIHGMVMFGITHLVYTSAFGLRPLKPWIALSLLVLGTLFYAGVYSYLAGPMVYAMAGYTLVLLAMSWRAMARASCPGYIWSWGRGCVLAGAAIFIVSDLLLAIDRFCLPLPHARYVVMATYYIAQMLITLSVADHSDRDRFWKRS
uniref:lysoplasmalogenase TMEM86A-like n=1 Tax=Pristiophorus japonicus TaxID=55135 RepID=UPI00398F018B